ncbi:MAG: hypothetical protein ACR2L9_06860 [Solirubrobacteraceae bacterium]
MLPYEPYQQAQTLQWLFFEQYSHDANVAVARLWTHAGTVPGEAERARRRPGAAARR